MNSKEIFDNAEKALSSYQICDACLGRIFRQIAKGKSNKQKGEVIRKKIGCVKQTNAEDCWLCGGLIDEIAHFSNLVIRALKEYEFDSFLIGSKVDEDILENLNPAQREAAVWERCS